MKIINTTPHEIRFINSDNNIYKIIPAGEYLIRLSVCTEKVGDIDGIPVHQNVYAGGTMPPKEKNTIYIVSKIVLEKFQNERDDFYIVSNVIKDRNGQILGVKGLARL